MSNYAVTPQFNDFNVDVSIFGFQSRSPIQVPISGKRKYFIVGCFEDANEFHILNQNVLYQPYSFPTNCGTYSTTFQPSDSTLDPIATVNTEVTLISTILHSTSRTSESDSSLTTKSDISTGSSDKTTDRSISTLSESHTDPSTEASTHVSSITSEYELNTTTEKVLETTEQQPSSSESTFRTTEDQKYESSTTNDASTAFEVSTTEATSMSSNNPLNSESSATATLTTESEFSSRRSTEATKSDLTTEESFSLTSKIISYGTSQQTSHPSLQTTSDLTTDVSKSSVGCFQF